MINVGKTDCNSSQNGTALKGCIPLMDLLIKLALLERGTKLDIENDNFDLEKVKELIKSGKMIVLPGHLSLENASEETVYETLGSGVMVFVRQGLYQLLVQYSGSTCLSKSLNQLASKNWDLILIDSEGKVFIEHTPDKFIKGFELSLNKGENLTFNDGSTSTKKPVRFQFSPYGTNAFNNRIDYFKSTDIDFASLEGIEDVYLDVISNTATNLEISVVNGCDKSTVIEGLDNLNYWKFVNASSNVEVKPSAVTYTNGVYKFTGITTGDYIVNLYDKTDNYPVISVGTNFFKTTANTTVAVPS